MEHYPYETMPINKGLQEVFLGVTRTVYWNDRELKRIVRLRILTDPSFPAWDVSYCWGYLRDGTPVNVSLPFTQLPKRGVIRFIVREAKRDRVYAKGLGIFDAISRLW